MQERSEQKRTETWVSGNGEPGVYNTQKERTKAYIAITLDKHGCVINILPLCDNEQTCTSSQQFENLYMVF